MRIHYLPTLSKPCAASVWNLPVLLLTLLAVHAGQVSASDTTWTEDGDNDRWSNPENWSNGVPGSGDRPCFNQYYSSGNVFVDYDSNTTVASIFVSDWPFGFGSILDMEVTINGRPGTELRASAIDVSADEFTLVDSGSAGLQLEEMEVYANRIVVSELAETEAVMIIDRSFVSLTLDLEVTAGAQLFVRENSVLQVGEQVTGTGSVSLTDGGALLIGNVSRPAPINDTIGTTISGNGAVIINGPNHVVSFSANNSFSGGLFLNAGRLKVSSGPQIGSLDNTLKFDGGTLEPTTSLGIGIPVTVGPNGGTIDTDNNNTSNQNWSSDGGAGTMRKTGTGRLTLQGNNDAFIGDWVVEQGTLAVGVGNSLGSQTNVTIESGARVTIEAAEDFGSLAGDGILDLGFPVNIGSDNTSTTFSGSIVGAAAFGKIGEGNFHINGNLGQFTGRLRLRGGTVELSVPTTSASTISFEGGRLRSAASPVILSAVDIGSPGEIETVGNSNLTISGPLSGDAEIEKTGAGTLKLLDIGTFTGPISVNQGTLELANTFQGSVNGSGDLVVRNGGTLTGLFGRAGGTTRVESGGTVQPGDANVDTAVLYFDDLVLESGSLLDLELGGDLSDFDFGQARGGAISEYDSIFADGTADLSGIICVSLINGIEPTLGDRWNLATAMGGFIGQLGTVQLPELENGLVWDVDRSSTTLSIEVLVETAFEADFDKDGDVDGEDFLVWQANFNTLDGTGTANTGDANGDGNVDGQDFLAWQNEFGSGLEPFGQATVPEPNAVLLAILTLAAVGLPKSRQSAPLKASASRSASWR